MTGKIALVGAAASGKDYLRKRFMNRGFVYGVSHTTRPPREGEVNGVDYYFVSDYKFIEMIGQDKFAEWQEFNGWKYGLFKPEFERCDVMILNAEAVDLLEPEYRDRLFVIYIDVDEEVRRERLVSRNDKDDSIDRRINADNEQFGNFSNFDCIITNDKF
jgi:guanylate kinase|tara:strand:- start:1411 stop:1890 length:480 start_codon:yes stop_codon:yes gene_type:complete